MLYKWGILLFPFSTSLFFLAPSAPLRVSAGLYACTASFRKSRAGRAGGMAWVRTPARLFRGWVGRGGKKRSICTIITGSKSQHESFQHRGTDFLEKLAASCFACKEAHRWKLDIENWAKHKKWSYENIITNLFLLLTPVVLFCEILVMNPRSHGEGKKRETLQTKKATRKEIQDTTIPTSSSPAYSGLRYQPAAQCFPPCPLPSPFHKNRSSTQQLQRQNETRGRCSPWPQHPHSHSRRSSKSELAAEWRMGLEPGTWIQTSADSEKNLIRESAKRRNALWTREAQAGFFHNSNYWQLRNPQLRGPCPSDALLTILPSADLSEQVPGKNCSRNAYSAFVTTQPISHLRSR